METDGSLERRKAYSCLMAHSAVVEQMESCRSQGATYIWDKDAGLLTIRFNELVVVRAIQKGASDAPWVISFYNTNEITWELPDGV